MRQFGANSGGDKMPAFTDDNSIKKFKNKTEVFSSKGALKTEDTLKTKERKIPSSMKDNIPNIVNHYGYSIPNSIENKSGTQEAAELREELTTATEDPVEEETPQNILKPSKTSKYSMAHGTPILHTSSKNVTDDIQTQSSEEFIRFEFQTYRPEENNHFEFKEKATEDLFKQEKSFHYDKTAVKSSTTKVGGGAKIEASFDKNGNIKSKISLNKGRERTDRDGFRNTIIEFQDKAENVYEDVRNEEDEALVSAFDSKLETLFLHSTKRNYQNAHRYKEISKDVKKDIKQLEKNSKKRKNEEYFKHSNMKFSDEMGSFAFTTPIEQKFGEQSNGCESLFENKADRKENDPVTHISQLKVDEKQTPKVEFHEGAQTESKFESRTMTNQEKLEQSKSKRQAAKKGERKEVRKAATLTAVAKMLESKKNIQNQLADMSGQTTGDLIKDGSSGLLTTFSNTVKQAAAHLAGKVGIKLLKALGSVVAQFFVPICFMFLVINIAMATFAAVGSLLGSDAGSEGYDLDVSGDGYLYKNLTSEQIAQIIEALYENYDDFDADHEQVLLYALTKVGCAYDQGYHSNLNVNIFDCSSLAYRSYRSIGVDISNKGAYSAAEECHAMMNAGKTVSGDLKPGDLIFYGGSDNGRYMGIYHVAIYVGRVNGVDKMVEAKGVSYGVVYGDVRTKNVVNISRPI